MNFEKQKYSAEEEGKDLPDNFNMPEWLKTLDGLTPPQKAEVREAFLKTAENARSERERFSSLFIDHKGWEDVFGNGHEHHEFGPGQTSMG